MAAALVLATGAATVQSGAAPVTESLPDLVSDPPANQVIQTYSRPGQANQLLLRFEGYVHNQGTGALEVRGTGPGGGRMASTVQRIYRSDGSFADDASRGVQIVWEAEDGHNHWHVKNAARYSLWSADRTAMVAPAMKVGFCLIDYEKADSHGPSNEVYTLDAHNFCAQGNSGVPSLVEGISPGWRDVYPRTLAFQWVDVSDVQPGTYWLLSEADPDNWARERNESNPGAFASRSSIVPGYVARGVDAGVIGVAGPTTVRLATNSFGSGLGAAEFSITAAPRHGTLSKAVGARFRGGEVTYTPDPGWLGPDRFTYEAHDSTSEFPRHPVSAAAIVAVGGTTPAVAISGAPARMYTSSSVRLTAQLLRAEGVTWTVNGIPGGSPVVGTIDANGLYVAPARVPAGGRVTIRATTPSGAWEEVTIEILQGAPPQAAPAPARLAMRVRGTRNLYGIRVAAQGDLLLVKLRSRRAGVVRIRANRGKKSLGRCRARMPRYRALTCKIRLRGAAPERVRLVITLRRKGKLLDVRRASLRHLRHHVS